MFLTKILFWRGYIGRWFWKCIETYFLTPVISNALECCEGRYVTVDMNWKLYYNWYLSSDGSNNVGSSMFDCSKPKIECCSLITNRWTCSSSFINVRKKDVRVSSMSNLLNVVTDLLGPKSNVRLFVAKTRVFDHQ